MSPDDLETQFPGLTYWARQLVEDGNVSISGRSLDREKFFGMVNENRTSQRLLATVPRPEQQRAEGECSCRTKDCVHLCALLMLYFQQQQPQADASSADPLELNDQRQLIYCLHPQHQQIRCQTQLVVVDPQGRWQRRLDYQHRPNSRRPRYLQPLDELLLTQLQQVNYRLGASDDRLLEQLLASGRCHLQDQAKPLRLGPERPLQFHWQPRQDGSQLLRWDCQGAELTRFPQPWYLDPDSGDCGRASTDLSPTQLSALDSLRLIRPDQQEQARQKLAPLFADQPQLLPPTYPIRHCKGSEPQPVLRVSGPPQADSLLLELLFEYAGALLPDPASNCHFDGQSILCVERDQAAEQRHLAELNSTYPSNLTTPFERRIERRHWRLKGAELLDHLRQKQWRIEYAEDFDEAFVFPEHWYGLIEESPSQPGWLDLSVGIELDGEQINLVPLLCDLIHSDDPLLAPNRLLQMDDAQVIGIDWQGKRLALPIARLRPLLKTLFELYQETDEEPRSIRLSPVRAANYRLMLEPAADAAAAMRWQEPARLQALREQLRHKQDNPSDLPIGLQAELRPYQQQGLGWLQFLQRHGIGGILADDMGLGKTLQTLAWLLWQKQQTPQASRCPSLVLAPTSLLGNWRAEAKKFAPDLRVLLLHGPQRQQHFDAIPAQDLVITSYPLLVRDQELLAQHNFASLILDEAQWIKNPNSQTARAVRGLQAQTGLCLTGTPLENHLGEFWALFDFLMPGFLGGPNLFQKLVRDPIEKQGDLDTNRRLAQRVRPFMLRRTKQEVLAELPPKTEIERCIELEDDQRELYESIRSIMHQRVQDVVQTKGLARSSITILDALLKLRQVCCDPRLVKLLQAREVKRSVKLDYLRLLLPELVNEGRRILLFSQFTSMLSLIETEVQELGIGYVKLTGQTEDRDSLIQRFQACQVPLFLISLKAGGTGLNLTTADTVIHYDPWWNPAVERQATDRAHRIGQDKPVFVYKLLCEGTVETRIRDLQQRKQELADNLFEATGKAKTHWDISDLEMLFAPLEEM
ncbi:MAG: DEAD/DEAH box helicase [Gammaproteobacteria bacterium]|nr:DEAD/DEAH box helicase [Gammaproteobacteria bacterium]